MMIIKNTQFTLTFFMIFALTHVVNASPRMISSGGVIADSQTGLQWQDSYPNNNAEVKSGSFEEASQYCSQLILAEKDDWRIPTQSELLSIVDRSRVELNQPAIQPIFNHVLTEETYLTSTHYEDDDETVWVVDFTHGESEDVALTTTDGYHIRCVRSE